MLIWKNLQQYSQNILAWKYSRIYLKSNFSSRAKTSICRCCPSKKRVLQNQHFWSLISLWLSSSLKAMGRPTNVEHNCSLHLRKRRDFWDVLFQHCVSKKSPFIFFPNLDFVLKKNFFCFLVFESIPAFFLRKIFMESFRIGQGCS